MPARKKRRFDKLLFERLPLQITNTSQAPRDDDIYYRCSRCGSFLSSAPKQSVICRCGRVSIDVDYVRLFITDYTEFEVHRLLDDDTPTLRET